MGELLEGACWDRVVGGSWWRRPVRGSLLGEAVGVELVEEAGRGDLLGGAVGVKLLWRAVPERLILCLHLLRKPCLCSAPQQGLRNACISMEVGKPWGPLGASWKPRKIWPHREHRKQCWPSNGWGNSKKGGRALGTGLTDVGDFSGKRDASGTHGF